MGDMTTREGLMREVRRRLPSPRFTQQLPATADDGSKPVAVAMREDTVSSMMDQVSKLGGTANVVIPMWGGMTVLAVQQSPPAEVSDVGESLPSLLGDATVGVLLDQMMEHGADIQVRLDEHSSSSPGVASDPHVVGS